MAHRATQAMALYARLVARAVWWAVSNSAMEWFHAVTEKREAEEQATEPYLVGGRRAYVLASRTVTFDLLVTSGRAEDCDAGALVVWWVGDGRYSCAVLS